MKYIKRYNESVEENLREYLGNSYSDYLSILTTKSLRTFKEIEIKNIKDYIIKTNTETTFDLRDRTSFAYEESISIRHSMFVINIVPDNDEYYYVEYSKSRGSEYYKIDSFDGLILFLDEAFLSFKTKNNLLKESAEENLCNPLGFDRVDFLKILSSKQLRNFTDKEIGNIKDFISKANRDGVNKLDLKFTIENRDYDGDDKIITILNNTDVYFLIEIIPDEDEYYYCSLHGYQFRSVLPFFDDIYYQIDSFDGLIQFLNKIIDSSLDFLTESHQVQSEETLWEYLGDNYDDAFISLSSKKLRDLTDKEIYKIDEYIVKLNTRYNNVFNFKTTEGDISGEDFNIEGILSSLIIQCDEIKVATKSNVTRSGKYIDRHFHIEIIADEDEYYYVSCIKGSTLLALADEFNTPRSTYYKVDTFDGLFLFLDEIFLSLEGVKKN